MKLDIRAEPRLFTRAEMIARLREAAARCARCAREHYCEGPLPEGVAFTLPGTGRLHGEQEIAALLVREDGWHRPDIRLSPVACTSDALVIELCWPDEWTDRLIIGKDAFPVEPFIVHGPALPPEWNEGDPMPRIRLPSWEGAPTG